MKVTQVIKEAITARVKAKCEEANKEYQLALDAELERLDNEKEQCLEDLRKEYKQLFLALLEKMDDKRIAYSYHGYSGDITSKEGLWEKNFPSIYLNVTSDYVEELRAKILENLEKAMKIINDIILELELGESKPTLESLVANIKF